jgi:asparagine synthase (glutamine-hydrolysing)
VVIDGSIYNLRDFPEATLTAGPCGDAELIANLYLEKGLEATLQRLNGDFALGLYDFRQHTLYLARDRFGLKPLYYYQGGGPPPTHPGGESLGVGTPQRAPRFAFASRPRALLQLPGVSASPNRKFVALFAAGHYRYFDNDPETSPYANIAQLPAATILCLKEGGTPRLSQYWSLKDLPDYPDPEAELAIRYSELLFDAVKIRLQKAGGPQRHTDPADGRPADKPAFTLSGGMDSSSVLISAVKLTGKKQPVFSSVYTDKTYDETNEIRTMLDAAVEQWHTVRVDDPEVFSLVEEMVGVHDEPVATATWLSHYLLCREVKARGFTGLFGGLGGDELNAGEYEYYLFHFADLRRAGKEEQLQKEARLWMAYHNHPIYQKNFQVMEDGLQSLVDLAQPGRCLVDQRRLRRYLSALNPDYYDLSGFVPIMEHPFKSYLKNRAYQDLTRETAPCCLRAEDRQTAAFGLENFLPFFDHRLVEFMFRVPGHYKIRNGITKHLLRQAMKGILPEETRTRIKKTGWNAPAHIWFSAGSRNQLLDLIHSREFRERGIYHIGEVERLVNEHYDIVTAGVRRRSIPQENHMMFLWQLVNLELWFRCCGVGTP